MFFQYAQNIHKNLLITGLVAHNKVDFSISNWGIRHNRVKVADYLIMDEDTAVGRFYIKNPRDTYES